jgi:hypothetical protein
MAAAAHTFPAFTQAMGAHSINLSSDTLKVGLASGTFNWVTATEAYSTAAQFLANAGSGGGGALTEVSYSGASPSSRITLSSVTYTESGLVSTLTSANPSWTTATWTADYAFFYDYTAGGSSDTAGLLICYWDFGGNQTIAGQTFTLSINSSGITTWTSS